MHKPPRLARGLVPPLVAAGALGSAHAGEVAVLYDPDVVSGTTQTLVDQGFEKLSSDIFNQTGFYAAGESVTEFDSGPENGQIASFFTHGLITGNPLHPDAQILDRTAGFRVRIDLAIDFEQHDELTDLDSDGIPDAAGFSIAIISSDLRGVGISFWQDRIWVNEDDAEGETELLSQAESVDQTPAQMGTLRRYEVEVIANAYRLRVDGEAVLSGRLRDYSNFPGVLIGATTLNNFDKPNSITIGDATRISRSRARIGDIATETPYEPEVVPRAAISTGAGGGIRLEWSAIPGAVYSLRSSEDLGTFEEFDDQTATLFEEVYLDGRPLAPRRFYKIVPLGAPMR